MSNSMTLLGVDGVMVCPGSGADPRGIKAHLESSGLDIDEEYEAYAEACIEEHAWMEELVRLANTRAGIRRRMVASGKAAAQVAKWCEVARRLCDRADHAEDRGHE